MNGLQFSWVRAEYLGDTKTQCAGWHLWVYAPVQAFKAVPSPLGVPKQVFFARFEP